MSKIELDNITSGYNLGKINANFVKIENALTNNVLFRDATGSTAGPNQMVQNIDMDSQSILNLPTPTEPTNPVRLQDLGDYATSTELTEVDNRLTAADTVLQNNINTESGLRISGDAILTGAVNSLDGRVTTLEQGTSGTDLYIHWLYNNGLALGGEVQLNIPYEFTSIATVYINGVRMSYGLAFDFDVAAKTVQLAEPLVTGDEVVVSLGVEPQEVSALVQSITEEVVLTDGQTVVTFVEQNTNGAAYHINGPSVDSRFLSSEDFTASSTTSTTITLTESYPAGSIITLSKNVAGSGGIDGDIRREFVHNEPTLAVAVTSTLLRENDAINLRERTTGNGGGAMWDVVLSTSVTENGYNIVQCTGVPTLSLVLRQTSFKPTDSPVRAIIGGGAVKIAVLGDSTEAGVGAGGTVYGEANSDGASGFSGDLNFAAIQNSSFFVPPTKADIGYQSYDVNNNTGTRQPRLLMTVGATSVVSKEFTKLVRSEIGNDLFIYFGTRTADTAARAVVTVYDKNNVQVHQETIDSYVADIDFGTAGTVTQGVKARQFKLTNALSTVGTNDKFKLQINGLSVVTRDGGATTPTDGTMYYYGVSQQEASEVYNFAVGSSTLKEASSANVSRGITTSGQMQKAYDLGCKVFFLGWGTNDSKTGISNTSDFENEYTLLIADIRLNVPYSEIILITAPKGETGSVYENNTIYNQSIRKLANTNNVGLVDSEKFFSIAGVPNTVYYDDAVHPNENGYYAILGAICSKLGIPKNKIDSSEVLSGSGGGESKHELATTSDATGNFITVLDYDVATQSKIRVSGVINMASASEMINIKCRVIITNAKSGATVTLAEQIVNIAEVGTLAIGQLVFDDFYKFTSNPLSSNVQVQLANYAIRNNNSTSVIIINAE